MKFSKKMSGFAVVAAMAFSGSANALTCDQLKGLPGFDFETAVTDAYTETLSLGFGLGMWATLMDTTGEVCSVFSVDGPGAENSGDAETGNTAWLGSRVISAQKANTANAFSLDTLSIPTGAITVATYEGGSLYGLQFSNPVDASIAYLGDPTLYGTGDTDPLVTQKVGGVNVFGGGIALYSGGVKVGAVGVSGDTSCRDAAMAFRVRDNLAMGTVGDALALIPDGNVLNALFQQPACGVNDPDDAEYFGVFILDKPGTAGKSFSPVMY